MNQNGSKKNPAPVKKLRWMGHILSSAGLSLFCFLWGYFHLQKFSSLTGFWRLIEGLLIFQNAMLAIFFICRRQGRVTSWHPWDVLTSLLGSFALSLFWGTHQAHPHLAGIFLQITGSILTVYAYASLGRSIGVLPANRKIQKAGMYRFVRHPIYLSYFIYSIGYLINHPSLYNTAVAILGFLSQLLRIYAEEKILSRDPEYARYQERVRWRLIPFIY